MKKIVWAGLIVLAVIYFSFSLDKAFRYSQKQSLKEMSTNYKEEQFKIISACTKEIEALPTVELYIKRGNAYATLSGFKEFIPKNYAKGAIFDYNQAIAIDPNSFDAYYNRALIFLKEKDYDQAISSFTKAIEIKPNNNFGISFVYYMRARAFAEKGYLDKAILDYTKTLELNPHDPSVYDERAKVYFSIKEYEKAWLDVHKAESLGHVTNPGFLKVLREASGSSAEN